MADKQAMNYVAIRTEGLTKTYKGKKGRKVEALKDLNLEVKRGEVFGLLGPNGAGKSTTIKLLMGLIFPDSGSFYLNGIDGRKTEARVSVGYLPENPPFMTTLLLRSSLILLAETLVLMKRPSEKGQRNSSTSSTLRMQGQDLSGPFQRAWFRGSALPSV
jgi:ABC-type multidrug transport system ATPase subunit